MNYFGLNIKNLREFWNLTQSDVGHLIGATRGMIMQYEGRQSGAKHETVAKFSQLSGFSEETLINTEIKRKEFKPLPDHYFNMIAEHRATRKNKSPNAVEKAFKYRISLKQTKKPIPMYNVKIAAGNITLINDEPELIVEFIDIPFIGDADGAVEVVGESMIPNFRPGARVAVRKLEDKFLLNWGEVYYIIDTNFEGYIKRLYPGVDDSHIILKSDNPDKEAYPVFSRKWENIVAIFKVKADITKH